MKSNNVGARELTPTYNGLYFPAGLVGPGQVSSDLEPDSRLDDIPGSGFCCFLNRWTSPETLEAGAMSAAIFETVIAEILKSYWANDVFRT